MRLIRPLPSPAHRLALRRPREPCPVTLYLARLASPASRTSIRYCLQQLAKALTNNMISEPARLDWAALRYADTVTVLGGFADKALSTRRLLRVSLHGVLRECWRLGLMRGADYQQATDTPIPKGERLPAGRVLTAAELKRLWRVAMREQSATGRRNAALLALFYATGMRRQELLGLDVSDYESRGGVVRIRQGKGARQRLAYVADARLRRVLVRWLRVRGTAPGPLLCQTDRHDHVHLKRLHKSTPNAVIEALCRAARIRHASCHDFRRTTATLVAATEPLDTVQKFLGHAHISTTALYVRREGDTVRRAAARVKLPV